MNITQISGGWFLIIPTTAQAIVISALFILFFMIGRGSALNHLLKHHIDKIVKSETGKLKREKAELITENELLRDKNHEQFVRIQGAKKSLE